MRIMELTTVRMKAPLKALLMDMMMKNAMVQTKEYNTELTLVLMIKKISTESMTTSMMALTRTRLLEWRWE